MNEEKVVVSLAGAIEKNNTIYGIDTLWNLLLSIDVESEKVKILSAVPEWSGGHDFSDILYWNNYLVLIPLLAKKIWIYSLSENSWEYIDVIDCVTEEGLGNFAVAHIRNDYLYLIGNCFPGILKVDLNTKSIVKKLDTYENVLVEQAEKKDGFAYTSYAICNDKMYIASGISNIVHIIDLKDDTYEDVIVGETGKRYAGIAFDGKNFWLAARVGSDITKWNGQDDVEVIEIDGRKNVFIYSGIFFTGKCIVLDGLRDEDTVVVDCEKGEMTKGELQLPVPRRFISDTKIWGEDKLLCIVDKYSMKVEKSFALAIDIKEIQEYLNDSIYSLLVKKGSVLEAELFNLHDFVKCII